MAYEHYLKPLEPFLKKKGAIEVCVNQPGEVAVYFPDGWKYYPVLPLSREHLDRFGRLLATRSEQEFSAENPILSTSLPGYGYRVQILGRIVESGISITIRIALAKCVELETYEWIWWTKDGERPFASSDLEKLKRLIQGGERMLVGGGTGHGKTTLLNSLIPQIPVEERVICVEDAKEIDLPLHRNQVRIVFSRTGTDMGKVTQSMIIDSLVRMRPDRILYGEVSTKNADSILLMNNSGHKGSMTTIHADDPSRCLLKFKQLIEKEGGNVSMEYITSSWDYIFTVHNQSLVKVMKVEH